MPPTQDPPRPEIELALAYARPEDRSVLQAMFALDETLARAMAVASEPIVGQLRLAWWRDALSADLQSRPRGNPELDRLVESFGMELARLVPLVDGWEALLLAEGIDRETATAFATGRAQAWLAVANLWGCADNASTVVSAAQVWALADLASGTGTPEGREAVLALASEHRPMRKLPRRLRPLAVLAALSRRALARGGEPLLSGRGSAVTALRAGLFGR